MNQVAHFKDSLVALNEGDEAVHLGTGDVVRRYCGYIYYLIPTGRGSRESKWECDIHRKVEDVIDDNQLPGIWVLLPKLSMDYPDAWKYSD